MKTDVFQSYGHCWVFQICWHIECSTFTASSFRIWNSSTGIPSPPPALFTVMLPNAHLTSHSRMSGSMWVWVITSSWLSGLWRSFLYSSSVYSCHLYLISSASLRSIPFQASAIREPWTSKCSYGRKWRGTKKPLDESESEKVEWESLEISPRKLEIPKEHFMQRWAQ